MAEEEVLTDRALSESLDEDIGKTLREIQSRPENQIVEEAPAPEKEQAEPAAPASAEKPRAPDGKFVAAKDAPKSAAPAKADTPTTPATAAAPEQEAAEPPLRFGKVEVDLTRPPSSWKPAAKVAWAALPDEVRKEIYRRETDFSNTVLNGPLKESADFGKSVRQVIEPYRGMIEAEGGTPERAVADLLKTAQLFRTAPQATKLQALFQIDQQFGAGLAQYVQSEIARHAGQAGLTAPQPQTGGQAQVPFVDPRVDQILQSLQAQERARAQEEEKASNAAVDAFFTAKDDKGQLLYPFVDNVLDDMTARVSIIRRNNPGIEHASALKKGYEEAVWANPETRDVLIRQQQAQAAAPAEALRKAGAARAATAGHIPKRGGLPASAPEAHLRLGTAESDASIKETLRQLTANA